MKFHYLHFILILKCILDGSLFYVTASFYITRKLLQYKSTC